MLIIYLNVIFIQPSLTRYLVIFLHFYLITLFFLSFSFSFTQEIILIVNDTLITILEMYVVIIFYMGLDGIFTTNSRQ